MKKKFQRIYNKSSEDMSELRDSCVHLVVTSPPYNVGMEYENVLDIEEWRESMRRVWKECYRVLRPDGRICVNITGTGRRPYVPLQAFITVDLLEIGFQMRGDIVWDKGASSRGWRATSWGSWRSASDPHLRDRHEYILVFSKEEFKRRKRKVGTGWSLEAKEFMDWTLSLWDMRAESATQVGHPAPFPLELPYRLIKLFSFEGDIVLDPFMGSGTTALAARRLKRRWVGYEVDEGYVKLANGRLRQVEIDFDIAAGIR